MQWLRERGYIGGAIRLAGLETALLTAIVFGVVNALIRPVVLVFTCLVNLLTLGLFTLVVNALMLWLTSALVQWLNLNFETTILFAVDDFLAAFVGALVISIVSAALTRIVR